MVLVMGEVYVLGIHGSPRKYGESYKLLRIALEAAKAEGAHVELVNLYDYRIEFCRGCVSESVKECWYPCRIEDDFPKLAEKVLKADALIFSTPIYWYAPSAILKNFIDRLTCFENMIFHEPGKSLLEGKVAGIIAVGNDTGAIMAIAWMMVTLNSMGVHIPPWALAYYHQKRGNVLEDESAMLDAANVGRIVVIAARALKGIDKWYEPALSKLVEKVKPLVAEEAERIRRECGKPWESRSTS